MITVQQALQLVSQFAGDAGMSPQSQNAMDELNRARMLLYPLGDWDYLTEYAYVTVDGGGCLYLPFRLGSIRMVWGGCCQKSGIPGRGEYYRQIVGTPLCGDTIGAPERTGMRSVLPMSGLNGVLGFSINDSEDVGTEVEISYTNRYGTIISETKTLDILGDIVYTDYDVKDVKSITKPRTNGDVDVSLDGVVLSTMSFIDRNMMHEQYLMRNQCKSCILIKAKKRFFDYTFDDVNLPLDIDNIDAIEFAMIAINSKKKNDLDGYQKSLLFAQNHLNLAKEDKEESLASGIASFNQFDLGLSYK